MATDTQEWNPQNVDKKEYTKQIGSTVNEVEEYISHRIQSFVQANGKPTSEPHYFTGKSISVDEKVDMLLETLKTMDWNQG